MTWLYAIWAFLKRIPWQAWALAGLVAGGWYYGHLRFNAGEANVQAKWDAAIERGKKEVERLNQKRVVTTTKVEVRTVEKIRVIHEKGATITKLVDRFVPVGSGDAPGSFRLFYDAAITNTVPDPARIPDAAPVALADVARTDALNFERCHVAYATVLGWQEWAAAQAAVR